MDEYKQMYKGKLHPHIKCSSVYEKILYPIAWSYLDELRLVNKTGKTLMNFSGFFENLRMLNSWKQRVD